jgi:formylglycine-generating enzyme required for sulfatase activity
VHEHVVYALTDTNYAEPYFATYEAEPDDDSARSQISYLNGTFSVRSRDGYSMANHPVVEVTWYGAQAFCDYYGYRLPTPWEWQAVADYDGSYFYCTGESVNQSMANYKQANPLGLTSNPPTSPVGYYPAYGYGLYDMGGNVDEWTSPVRYGVASVCGGSWLSGWSSGLAVNNRTDSRIETATYRTGFRVARDAPVYVSIIYTNGALTLSWPWPTPGFVLEETSELGSPTDWTEVSPPYSSNATHYFITIPEPTGKRFYRLRRE